MKKPLGETESLCPECLGRIPAKRISEKGDVYIEKYCPDHGKYKTILWRDDRHYRYWNWPGRPGKPKNAFIDVGKGCPYDCGLCPEHIQDSCVVLIEVTERCNINCPVCFSNSRGNNPLDPELDIIREMYETILDSGGYPSIQLSGGEPTIRDDLPEIVRLGRSMGFDHIQINTNGIRLADDIDYLQRLKDSGASVIYLQFDGMTDEVYRHIRDRDLLETKLRAIINCEKVKIGIILVSVLIPRVNDGQIGDIIRFAKKWIPTVRGVHFQPISYFGRYPELPKDEDRITIPEVLKALEDQTGGELKMENFVPPS